MQDQPQISVETLDTETLLRCESSCAGVTNIPKATTNRSAIKHDRLVPNLVANIAGFAVSVFIGIWYTPYLIHSLGTESYGIIPLATTMVGYMSVVTLTLNAAVARYLTIELERNDFDAASRCFNTSFFGSLILAVILTVPLIWAVSSIDYFIVVPDGQLTQTKIFFGLVAAMFLMNAIITPFGVASYCRNRFDLRNICEIGTRIFLVGTVILLFSIVKPQLWLVGLAMCVATLAGGMGAVWVWRYLLPKLSISIKHFDLSVLKRFAAYGSWISVNQIGVILFVGIDLLVVNRLFGPEDGGRYAAVMTWSTLLRSFTMVLAAVFGPTMLFYYARDDIDGLIRYSRRAVKLLGLLIALPIGLICGLSRPLLQTWLGLEFADSDWLMSLMTVHLSVTLATLPLFGIQTAVNRVRMPALVTLIMGAVNLGLAIFLAGPMGWGLYGVAAAGAVALTAKNLVFTPLYTAHILGRRFDAFLWEIMPITLATLGTAATCKMIATWCDVSGWPRLTSAIATISILYAAVGYYILLNREDRILAWSMVPMLGSRFKKDLPQA